MAEVTRDEPGYLSALLHGSKLAGGFALTGNVGNRWIPVKTRDSHARPGSRHRDRAARQRPQRQIVIRYLFAGMSIRLLIYG